MSVAIMNRKARSPHEIVCRILYKRGERCPNHPDGLKFRGKNKCWGCEYAAWLRGALAGKPYGPLRRMKP